MYTSLDRIKGMFAGVFIGDALGAPHEFKGNAKTPYTGKLEHAAFLNTQFQGRKELAIGQVTDDSEMTLALLRTILRDRDYVKNNVIQAYLEWANSGGWMIGINTKALFRGVRTIKGYEARIAKVLAVPEDQRSQSNGALMRCSPLALIWDNQCVLDDVAITNPSMVVMDAVLVHVTALRFALQGIAGPEIFENVSKIAQTAEVQAVIAQVRNREVRNIVQNKGWCLHAVYCMLMVITSFTSYSEAMRWVITSQPGSDTDTNACIAGAVLGAILGYEALELEPDTRANLEIVIACDTAAGPTPRPEIYSPHDFHALCESAYNLTQQH